MLAITPDPPVWLKRLMSVCSLRPKPSYHQPHVVFVSLETLLTLLEWQLSPSSLPPGLPGQGQGTVDVTAPGSRLNFLPKMAVDHVLSNFHFEKVRTLFVLTVLRL